MRGRVRNRSEKKKSIKAKQAFMANTCDATLLRQRAIRFDVRSGCSSAWHLTLNYSVLHPAFLFLVRVYWYLTLVGEEHLGEGRHSDQEVQHGAAVGVV